MQLQVQEECPSLDFHWGQTKKIHKNQDYLISNKQMRIKMLEKQKTTFPGSRLKCRIVPTSIFLVLLRSHV